MPTFVTTINFTQQGLQTVGQTTRRAAALRAAARKLNAKVKEVYWTLGDHDGVLIFEAPDDETATALMLQLASQGNVQTSTSRAFTAAEVDAILARTQAQ